MTLLLAPCARAQQDGAGLDAVQELRTARVLSERGDFTEALERFRNVLDSQPPKVRDADQLHEGFLFYAFTLFLDGRRAEAEKKLQFALRIDPDFEPSPVTTRPDTLAFYQERRAAYLATYDGVREPLEAIFPTFQANPGAGQTIQRVLFVPVFGFGLQALGHRRPADGIRTLEVASLVLNVAALVTKASLQHRASPEIAQAKLVMGWATLPTFAVFWGTVVADLVVSLALQQRYRLHPELRPVARTAELRPALRLRALAPPTLVAGGLSFW